MLLVPCRHSRVECAVGASKCSACELCFSNGRANKRGIHTIFWLSSPTPDSGNVGCDLFLRKDRIMNHDSDKTSGVCAICDYGPPNALSAWKVKP